jgi:hypothetical protein
LPEDLSLPLLGRRRLSVRFTLANDRVTTIRLSRLLSGCEDPLHVNLAFLHVVPLSDDPVARPDLSAENTGCGGSETWRKRTSSVAAQGIFKSRCNVETNLL